MGGTRNWLCASLNITATIANPGKKSLYELSHGLAPEFSLRPFLSPWLFTSSVSTSLIHMGELRLFGRHGVDVVSTRDVVSLDYSLAPPLKESPGTAAPVS